MTLSTQQLNTCPCGSGQRGAVLLVDDDPDFLLQHKLALEGAGFAVLPAGSEEEAHGVLDASHPDVAVLDIMMEHVDSGFVLSHYLKNARPDMPVILVSSVMSETGLDFDTATAEERTWLKADAMLAKPVRYEQLIAEIERLLPK